MIEPLNSDLGKGWVPVRLLPAGSPHVAHAYPALAPWLGREVAGVIEQIEPMLFAQAD